MTPHPVTHCCGCDDRDRLLAAAMRKLLTADSTRRDVHDVTALDDPDRRYWLSVAGGVEITGAEAAAVQSVRDLR